MLIDTNVHLGPWPFAELPMKSGRDLAHLLAAQDIDRALVSPLDAAFLPDPLPANRRLLAATKSLPALVPVPIVNPALGHWREQLDFCLHANVHAVKLLPNYHHYRLTDRRVTEFMSALAANRLKLVINVRLQDERTSYFALRIKGVPTAELAAFLAHHPDQHPLLTGLQRPALKTLATQRTNFSADISFCEWSDTLADLLTTLPAARLLFGSGAPLLCPRAQADKLRLANLPARIKKQIGTTNAVRFFRL
jgi:predicted TIM-barrel fold metal-dependent hydrolase